MEEVKQEALQEDRTSYIEDFWLLVFGHARPILLITTLGFLASVFYFSLLPSLYTTQTRILAEKTEEKERSSLDMVMPSFKGEEDYYGTQISILTGRKISEMVQKDLGIQPGSYSLEARRLRGTRIISVSVTHTDPELAASIANKYAEVFVQESSKENLYISQQMLKFIPNPDEILSVNPQQEIPDSSFSKNEFAGSLSRVTSDPSVQKLREEKLSLQSSLRQLSLRYTPEHPSLRELNERLEIVDKGIKERTEKILGNLRANLAGEIKITNIKILETALVPRHPSKPNRPMGIFLGTLMSFVTSVFLVFILEYTNQKIITDTDIHRCMDVPFLGYIPLAKELQTSKGKSLSHRPHGNSIAEALSKNTRLADAVASVRTHVLFSMSYEKSKRIMLTSCVPDEGKSTVAALLAYSLTSMGRRILLVDADLRRPFVHNYLDIRNDRGLSDYLSGRATMEEIMQSSVMEGLKVVTGGSPLPNPSELLASERMAQFLDHMSGQFDRIVIDVPPVLYIPDGLIVAKHIHSGILVCGSGMIERKIAQRVKEKFDAIGHALIGVVINRANYEKEAYRYRYYKTYKNYYSETNK